MKEPACQPVVWLREEVDSNLDEVPCVVKLSVGNLAVVEGRTELVGKLFEVKGNDQWDRTESVHVDGNLLWAQEEHVDP